MRALVLLLLPAAIAAQQPAQPAQPSLADSVMMLTRDGKFEQAARAAKRGLDASRTVEDRCEFLIDGAFALTRMGESEAPALLRAVDATCTGTQAAARHATDIGIIRSLLSSAPTQAGDAMDRSKLPPLPKSGVDYTGIDAFYRIADILRAGKDPTPDEWNILLGAPGYQLHWQQDRSIRQSLILAFKPSAQARRDSMLAVNSDRANALRHLLRAYDQREQLMRTRDALMRTIGDSIAIGVRAAAKYLPAGTTESAPVPLVAFAIFADDGYALDGGVLLDPLFVMENGLTELISHEFHHSYLATVDKSIRPTGPVGGDVGLFGMIRSLRNEGIADQIDKPHPLPPRTGALAFYPARYNETYDKTPELLKVFDSLLVVVADDSTKAAAAGQRARQLFWSNGHPNGAYIAREIVETFGVDSLMPAAYNPFALLRVYAEAERKHGRPWPFSAKAQAKLDEMERRYVR